MSSKALYAGDGVTKQFVVPFPYIKRSDVQVAVNTVLQTPPLNWHFISDTLIEMAVAPGQADAVQVYRATESGMALAQFQDGSVLTEAELNLAVLQLLYLIQEMKDHYDVTLGAGIARVATGNGITSTGDVLANVTASVLESQLLADLQQRITDININAATIGAQIDRVNTLTDVVAALGSSAAGGVDDIATFLTNEQTARIAGDTAINETLSIFGAKSGDGLSFTLDMSKLRVSPTEALGTRLTALQSSIGSNTATIASQWTANVLSDAALSSRLDAVSVSVANAAASISTEAKARATADSAFSDQLNVVLAKAADNTAAVTAESTARASADGALTTRVDGMLALAGNNTALILSQQSAQADVNYSVATSLVTLQSGVGANTASISTQQTVTNGLAAQYMVKLDVNGYVTGFGLYSNASSSAFAIRADKFILVSPSGGARNEYSDGNWRMYDNSGNLRVRFGVW